MYLTVWLEDHSVCVFSLLLHNVHCFPKMLYKFTFLPAKYEFLLLHIFLDTWFCRNLEFSSSNVAIAFPWTPSWSLSSSRKDGRLTHKYIWSQGVKNYEKENYSVLWGKMRGVTWFRLKVLGMFTKKYDIYFQTQRISRWRISDIYIQTWRISR